MERDSSGTLHLPCHSRIREIYIIEKKKVFE